MACNLGCGTGCTGQCTGSCRGRCSTACKGSGQQETPKGCNGTCWQQCGGSCSSASAKVPDDNGNYNDRTGENGCWCGKDCAGCGGCSGKCSGCSGDCSGCSGSCGGSCSGTCSKGCSYTCTGDCKGYCKGTCADGCLGSCSTACTGQCSHLCNETCISDVAFNAFTHLNNYKIKIDSDKTYDMHQDEGDKENIVLDWLDANDMRHLFGMIQEEGRRRIIMKTGEFTQDHDEFPKTEGQTLTLEEEQTIGIRDEKGFRIEVRQGDFADDEKHIKKLINMLADNTNKSISLSVGGASIAEGKKIQKNIGTSLIEKAISCYNEKIPVNTTSEGTGKQTIEE